MGNRSLALIAPQVVLGVLLALCPDTRLPLVVQLLTLLHVASAIGSLLAFLLWSTLHARQRFVGQPVSARSFTSGADLVRITLAVTAVAAYATGFAALWYGQGTRVGDWHAAAGLALGLPLALHLLLDGGVHARRVAWLYVLIAPLAVPSIRAAVRPAPAPPPAVAFAPQTQEASLYDSAEWCGSCHVTNYEEWSHSSHSRALALPTVRKNFAAELKVKPVSEVDGELGAETASGGICVQCHAPITFFGADSTPILENVAFERQGISCGFCHTLRGLDESGFYHSAPQAIQRYIGQNSEAALPRLLGDLLIRWRPEVHRRDYRPAVLAEVAACEGCHIESFESWRESPYARHAAEGTGESAGARAGIVTCQDCHMASQPKGEPVREPGRLVPWGDVRPQRRQHVWKGGNARASLFFDDAEGVELVRGLRSGMIDLRIVDVQHAAPYVWVTAALRNNHVGHHYPSGEGGDARNQWMQLETFDSEGQRLDVTAVPDPRDPSFDQSEVAGRGVALIHQRGTMGKMADRDTRVPPKEERTYRLALPDSVELARVRVAVRSTFDPVEIATAEASLPFRGDAAADLALLGAPD